MSPYITKLIERPADHKQFAVLLGMDAMRACLGKRPRNFTVAEIIRGLQRMEATKE